MKRLSDRIGHLIVIIKEEENLSIVAIGKLERSNHYGFVIKDDINKSVHYFSSRFLKTRWKPHNYKLFPRNFLTLKKGYDTTKPPGSGGFEKRIRVKPLDKLRLSK